MNIKISFQKSIAFFIGIIMLSNCLFFSSCKKDDESTPETKPAFAEVLTFKKTSTSNQTVEQMVAMADAIGVKMAQQQGFVHRYVAVSSDTTFLFINLWKDQASATAANAILQTLSESNALNPHINFTTLIFNNVDLSIIAKDLNTMANAGNIEVVTFNAKSGITDASLIQKSKAMTDVMYTKDGYLSRFFGKNTTSGLTNQTQWVIANFWRDSQAIATANPVLYGTPESQALIQDIDSTVFFKEFTIKSKR